MRPTCDAENRSNYGFRVGDDPNGTCRRNGTCPFDVRSTRPNVEFFPSSIHKRTTRPSDVTLCGTSYGLSMERQARRGSGENPLLRPTAALGGTCRWLLTSRSLLPALARRSCAEKPESWCDSSAPSSRGHCGWRKCGWTNTLSRRRLVEA